jgi:hypothetical protein
MEEVQVEAVSTEPAQARPARRVDLVVPEPDPPPVTPAPVAAFDANSTSSSTCASTTPISDPFCVSR